MFQIWLSSSLSSDTVQFLWFHGTQMLRNVGGWIILVCFFSFQGIKGDKNKTVSLIPKDVSIVLYKIKQVTLTTTITFLMRTTLKTLLFFSYVFIEQNFPL